MSVLILHCFAVSAVPRKSFSGVLLLRTHPFAGIASMWLSRSGVGVAFPEEWLEVLVIVTVTRIGRFLVASLWLGICNFVVEQIYLENVFSYVWLQSRLG